MINKYKVALLLSWVLFVVYIIYSNYNIPIEKSEKQQEILITEQNIEYFNSHFLAVLPKKHILQVGNMYEAFICLTSYSYNERNPIIVFTDSIDLKGDFVGRIDTTHAENGLGRIKISCKKKGLHKVYGKYILTKEGIIEPFVYNFETSFNVE